MSQFVTYNQMVDFFNKKILKEEPEPEKAKVNQSTIQKLLKQYAKRGVTWGYLGNGSALDSLPVPDDN